MNPSLARRFRVGRSLAREVRSLAAAGRSRRAGSLPEAGCSPQEAGRTEIHRAASSLRSSMDLEVARVHPLGAARPPAGSSPADSWQEGSRGTRNCLLPEAQRSLPKPQVLGTRVPEECSLGSAGGSTLPIQQSSPWAVQRQGQALEPDCHSVQEVCRGRSCG